MNLPSRYYLILSLVILGAWLLSSCGGGSPYTTANTSNGMGTLLMTMTDAEGDFATYGVDVASITLKRANGTAVETLANQGRLDFTQYVDMTELFNTAQVPAGRYVASEITLNYTTADIQVEVAGVATPAEFIDETGNALSAYTITLQLDDNHPLVVTPGRHSLLSVDFDLDASHTVDTTVFPPRVTVAPFLVADVEPVAEKELRVSGSLVDIDSEAMSYSIRLRPWHYRHGDFGPMTIHVGEGTSFEIDGETFIGQNGLASLETAGPGTPTVAVGILDVVRRSFSATSVLVGESVPGHGFDGVIGNLGARNGDILTVRRATVIPESGSVIFNDEIQVTVGPETVVKKRDQANTQVNIGDLSVGQRVHIAGQITSDLALPGLIMDATTGRVRMVITRLDGIVNDTLPGLLSMNLQRIDRRPVRIFDFSGTGISSNVDTDPTNYEVATDTLPLATLTPGSVVKVSGFVRPFGAAPDDFEARSIVSLTTGRAKLGISWGMGGTMAPFLSMGTDDGLVPDLDNPDLGKRHHVKLGGVVLDLLNFSAPPAIIPTTKDRRRFAIKRGDQTRVFRNFETFTESLANLLDGTTVVKGMYAEGAYKQAENILTASIVNIYLQVP